ncbi:MAG TPA: hypothetical protein VFI30_03655 [Nocardioidaceae bacterium]|nr:hypothetical protein [Nocardioidaceae bacterium]
MSRRPFSRRLSRRRRRRVETPGSWWWAGVALVCLGLVSGCTAGPAVHSARTPSGRTASGQVSRRDFQPTSHDFADIRHLLATRARDILDGRRRAFLNTIDHRSGKLVQQQKALFANLRALPVKTITYNVQDYGLTPAEVAGLGVVLAPPVMEHVLLAGTDARAVANAVNYTFVRRHGRWLVGAVQPPSAGTENGYSRPWAGPPITVVKRGPLLVVVDESDGAQATALAGRVVSDIDFVSRTLHQPVNMHVLVDATTTGSAVKMGVTDSQEAAAVTYPAGAANGFSPAGIAGWRVKINPRQIGTLMSDQHLLRHELTHFVLRHYTSYLPLWLNEGTAQYVGYQPFDFADYQVGPGLYRKLMAPPHALPGSGVFYLYPQVDYLVGQATVTYLVDRFGIDRLLALISAYKKAYNGLDADSHNNQVLEQVYGISAKRAAAGGYRLLAELHH